MSILNIIVMIFLLLLPKINSLITPKTVEEFTTKNNNIPNEILNNEYNYENQTEALTERNLNITKQNFNKGFDSREENNAKEVSVENSLSQLYKLLNFDLDYKIGKYGYMNYEGNRVIPQFMNEMYQSMNKSKTEHSLPYNSETVIGLLEKDPSKDDIFKFSLDGLEDENIVEAELHLYRLSEKLKSMSAPYFLLKIYQISPNGNYKDHLYYFNPDFHQLLNVHYVPAFYTGWQVFKVKRAVQSWLSGTSPNLGFLVTITTILGEPIETSYARRGLHSDIYQPILVLYTNDKNQDSMKKLQTNSSNVKISSYTDCQRHNLVTKFSDIGWDKHIILPESFDMGQCVGNCSKRPNLVAENYIYIQNAMENMKIRNFREPCCVPTNLGDLPLLYYDLNENMILKIVKNMKIDNCGCL